MALKKYLIETRLMCAKIDFNPIKAKTKPTLRSCRLTLELEFCFIFILISAMNFKFYRLIMTTCAYNPCSVAIHFMLFFTSVGILIASFALSLQFFIKSSGKTRLFEIIFFYNFVDCHPLICIYFVSIFKSVNIFNINFYCFLICLCLLLFLKINWDGFINICLFSYRLIVSF